MRLDQRLAKGMQLPLSAARRGATANDALMMCEALTLARQAEAMEEVPVGAVVYRGRRILGRGFNRRESEHDPTAHAEIIAIQQAAQAMGSWRLGGCRIAVTLEPCCMCAGAIVHARLDALIYGATDPKTGAVHSLYDLCSDRRLNHRCPVIGGVMAHECGDILRQFFRRRRRRAG